MGFEGVCDTQLNLGFGLNSSDNHTSNPTKAVASFEPSLTLSLSSNHHDHGKKAVAVDRGGLYRQDSGGSSSASVKREREVVSEESERVSNHSKAVSAALSGGDQDVEDDDGSVNGRKKLRLTKPQSALLEEAFKLHSTLNPKQKQELARELKLRPRQVEVWFQNRRARSKLKQTEVDCEYLKKCCEKLTDENRRLHREVQELKAMTASQPLYMQLPAPRLTMCPSCERVGDTGSATKSPFAIMAPKPHIFNPFNNPSAAC